MCKAASFVVTREHKAFWHPTQDSHSDIIEHHKLHEGAGRLNIVPVELVPSSGKHNEPLATWVFSTDLPQDDIPEWYDAHWAEAVCRAALPEWAKKLDGVRLDEAYNPVNPLQGEAKNPTAEHVALLKRWASVRDSVWDSVGDSVWASVRASVGASVRDSVWASVWASVGASVRDSVWDSVRASVWASVGDSVRDSVRDSVWASVGDSVGDSVWDSVWASVGDSVWAYTGSLFPNIKQWRYTKLQNPWQPLRDLWLAGFVPSFDGATWRLHSGSSAKVVHSWKPPEGKS